MNTNDSRHLVTTTDALVAVVRDPAARHIVVRGELSDMPSIHLAPGQICAVKTSTPPSRLRMASTACA